MKYDSDLSWVEIMLPNNVGNGTPGFSHGNYSDLLLDLLELDK